jgi:hypothetical protein
MRIVAAEEWVPHPRRPPIGEIVACEGLVEHALL